MSSKSDLQREYQKELNTYRSQQIIINALMAVKEEIGRSDSDIAEAINLTYLANALKIEKDDFDSLFGIKASSKPVTAIQKAKLMKLLIMQLNIQCDDVISFTHKIKSEKKFNIFEIENIKNQIELRLKEYNERLEQSLYYKERVCELESNAVNFKTGSGQMKALEMFYLEAKQRITENERFKRIILNKICNQMPGNTEALLKLKDFVENLSE